MGIVLISLKHIRKWYVEPNVFVSFGTVIAFNVNRFETKKSIKELTSEIRSPIRMTISGENDNIIYFIAGYMFENPSTISPISIPSVLRFYFENNALIRNVNFRLTRSTRKTSEVILTLEENLSHMNRIY